MTPPFGARPFVGIVCGLQSEILRAERALGPLRHRADIRASGASADRARDHARALVAGGAGALVSFGLAGALDPALRAGDVVRPRRVISADGAFDGLGPDEAAVWGAEAIAFDPAEKARLHARTGAAIVDLESHAVAAEAARAGLPFLVIRAVSDDAATALPPYLSDAVDPEGDPNLPAILLGLVRRPGTLPALIRLGRDTERALDAAERAARADLPDLFRRLDLA